MTNPATQTLIQLPSKDLWRGCTISPTDLPAADAEVVPESAQNPINRAMAAILKSSAGARELTCIWCGMQSDEKYMRKHITDQHKSVIEPATGADAAMATLAAQQKPKIEAAANAK